MQDKFANSYGIYEENIGKKLKSEQKNVFICYRGMYSWGGAIAQVLYYTILCSRFSELIPFCHRKTTSTLISRSSPAPR